MSFHYIICCVITNQNGKERLLNKKGRARLLNTKWRALLLNKNRRALLLNKNGRALLLTKMGEHSYLTKMEKHSFSTKMGEHSYSTLTIYKAIFQLKKTSSMSTEKVVSLISTDTCTNIYCKHSHQLTNLYLVT